MEPLENLISAAALESAFKEAATLGRASFRTKYNLRPARKFVAIRDRHHIDTNALIASAYSHATGGETLNPADLSGGLPTTQILDSLDATWIDVTNMKQQILDMPDVTDATGPRFWWVNQGSNFDAAWEQRSLWAADLRADGNPGHKDRKALGLMSPGDIIFHYSTGKLRALSRVVQSAVATSRPAIYEPATGSNIGWLVLVEPYVSDIEIELKYLQSVLVPNAGPMNRAGIPAGVYTAPLESTLASKLTALLSGEVMSPDTPADQPADQAAVSISQPSIILSPDLVTDAWSMRASRVEQHFLRDVLLRSYGPRCALCSRVLPARLLHAAHIKPRAKCNDTERLDFRAVAMLACVLGCDALFEHGYVGVSAEGIIFARQKAGGDLNEILANLEGRKCLAFNESTAPNFEFHRKNMFEPELST